MPSRKAPQKKSYPKALRVYPPEWAPDLIERVGEAARMAAVKEKRKISDSEYAARAIVDRIEAETPKPPDPKASP